VKDSTRDITLRELIGLLYPRRSISAMWALGLLSVALTVGIVWTPVSPTALWAGETALGAGNPTVAVESYDAVARWNPWRSIRVEALVRGAKILSLELGEPAQARRRLQSVIEQSSSTGMIAQAHEQMGHLYIDEDRQFLAAGHAFRAAAKAAPNDTRSVDRWILSARAFTEVGHREMALSIWTHVKQTYPKARSEALIGMASIHLSQGDVTEALARFDDALVASSEPALSDVARLGVTACLERLGNLDEAIAEMDLVELPKEVRGARQDAMRARATSRPSR